MNNKYFGTYRIEAADNPEPTGRVYITMKSIVTGTPHLYIKQHKSDDRWLELTNDNGPEVFDRCWAFSRPGAKKIIERLKTKTYKANFDKGLLEFGMLDEYSC